MTLLHREALLKQSEGDRHLFCADPNAGWESALAIDKDMPVGLTNIANTCYLNSLLQVRLNF